MSILEHVRARQGAYALLSKLYLSGPSAELLPWLASIDGFDADQFDAESAAAEHHRVLVFNVHPNESIFLGDDGLLGNQVTEAVAAIYRRAGFKVDDSADHLGNELSFMAFLLGAELDALEDGLESVAVQVRSHQQRFLSGHLLRWIAPVLQGIAAQGSAFYAAIGEIAWELLAEHAVVLELAAEAQPLPSAPDLLSNEKASLKDIAEYLTTPVNSGWWFGRHQITDLGRALEFPRGFGGRVQTLTNLLRSSAQYDGATHVFGELQWRLHGRGATLAVRAEQHPSLAPFIQLWRMRLGETEAMLTEMQRQIAELSV